MNEAAGAATDRVTWPQLLQQLEQMETRIMQAVKENAQGVHTVSDRLDARLMEHSGQHSRERDGHAATHEREWGLHLGRHDDDEMRAEAAEGERKKHETETASRHISAAGLKVAIGAFTLQTVATLVAVVTMLSTHHG